MAPRGPLNLFSYFPKDSIPPDLGRFLSLFILPYNLSGLLGPKLYISEVRVPVHKYSVLLNTHY